MHIEPEQMPARTRGEAIAVEVRAIADGLGLGVHNLHLHSVEQRYTLDADVEVDAALSLEASHVQVTEFENRVRAALEDIVEVVTHIEPVQAAGAEEVAEDEEAERVRAQIVAVGDRSCGRGATHHITLRRLDGRYDVSLHVVAPGESSVVEAHLLAEEVERQLREAIAGLERVTVHVEPPEGRND